MNIIDLFFNMKHIFPSSFEEYPEKNEERLEEKTFPCHGCYTKGWVEIEKNPNVAICPICNGNGFIYNINNTDIKEECNVSKN